MNNKIFVVLIAFVLLFTLNLSLNNSHASLDLIYKLPVIITNNQNISTPNPFQQLIKLNVQTINNDLHVSNIKASIVYPEEYDTNGFIGGGVGTGTTANFEFTYLNGEVIPSWIEGNASGILLIWLKLTSILAHSSETIYLDIFAPSDNLLSSSGSFGIGENPLLSPKYGEYDDGSSVFDFYDNFAGKSLNGNNWVYGGTGSIIVNNSVYQQTNKYIYIITRNGFNPQTTICDEYSSKATTNAPYVAFSMTVGNFNNSNGYFWLDNSYNYFSNGSYSRISRYIGVHNEGFNSGNIESESWQSDNQIYITDYGYSDCSYENQTFDSYLMPSEVYYGIGLQNESNGFINTTWFRVRAYPPNGVMPSVYFDVGLNVSVSYQNNNLISNNTSIYSYNSTSGFLQFSNQYFSFMLDPEFLFYLVSIVFVIFSIYMGVAVVRRRKNG